MGSLRALGRADLLRLADALEAGKLCSSYTAREVGRYVSPPVAGVALSELVRLDGQGVHRQHVAYTARVLAEEKAAGQAIRDRVDLVWTGPELPGSVSRDSATVARELLGQAEESVLLASYTVEPSGERVKGLLGPLARRMDERPELDVRFFVNIGRKREGHQVDGRPETEIVREFGRELRDRWPGERTPRVYYDPRGLELSAGPRACLHAKVVVVDRKRALVTSANLTEAAHERNIEAGVLIDDEDVARTLERQFRSLVDAGLLSRVPGLGR